MSIHRTFILTSCLRVLAHWGLKLSGWKVDIELPVKPPFVFIGAPHTSNWDFLIMLAAVLALKLDARWLGKDSLFRVPFKSLMLWLGGIPTDRSRAGNQVENAALLLRENPGLVLCVAPEGTRSKAKRWKTGFYHIAHQAGVPILMTVLDAPARKVRLLGVHVPAGNAELELAEIQQQYRGYRGLLPANATEL